MNKIRIILLLIISSIIIGCKSRKNNYSLSQSNLKKGENYNLVLEISGKVESIHLDKAVYVIMVKDSLDRKYEVLSKKEKDIEINKGNKIEIGKDYFFRIKQLTNTNDSGPRIITINGKEIVVAPSNYVQDCIDFNSQKFCSGSWEVFEGVNLINLNIDESSR